MKVEALGREAQTGASIQKIEAGSIDTWSDKE
jgi:hypothetical protein